AAPTHAGAGLQIPIVPEAPRGTAGTEPELERSRVGSASPGRATGDPRPASNPVCGHGRRPEPGSAGHAVPAVATRTAGGPRGPHPHARTPRVRGSRPPPAGSRRTAGPGGRCRRRTPAPGQRYRDGHAGRPAGAVPVL